MDSDAVLPCYSRSTARLGAGGMSPAGTMGCLLPAVPSAWTLGCDGAKWRGMGKARVI